ncbi:uncharacterized protein LOC112557341 isoform X2 [Pomacea canaliculata]|uniref:uncharacterized protein LOC112557341 isoform X2 n=1 Tax=Pomacea canaliculata TaxID=400727 RepID=UPI000D732D70|nr:uncharacterized protein LOC112557341 isoform X2 [Pomacea canaliculata]XP_025082924.1 uncharacterized protein LOC112557341 isoform X2 [Pomacea canaliculata]
MFHLVTLVLLGLLTFEVTEARKLTSLQKQIDDLRGEFEAYSRARSDDKPYFAAYIQDGDWLLAFRLVAGNKQSGYDTYMNENINDDDPLVRALTPCSCLAVNSTCTRHYRGSILTQWSQLPINKVRLSLYEGGREKAYAVFNGAGSSSTSWFSADRLETSSWTDLRTAPKNFFSISGDTSLARRFFINSVYPGCANDAGWLVVKDNADTCSWGQVTAGASYPLILYSATGNRVLYSSPAVSRADSLAIWVSFKAPDTVGQACFS